MVKKHRVSLTRVSVTHFRVERLHVLTFRVQIAGGTHENRERVGERLHPRFIISCEDFQLLNTEASRHPPAVEVIFQSGLACYIPQQLRKRVLHDSIPPYLLVGEFVFQLAALAFFLLSNSSSSSVERLSILRNVSAFFSKWPGLGSPATSNAASDPTVGASKIFRSGKFGSKAF